MTTHVIPANAGISGTLGTAELRNARDGGTAERPGRRNGGTPGTTSHVIPANAGISGKLG